MHLILRWRHRLIALHGRFRRLMMFVRFLLTDHIDPAMPRDMLVTIANRMLATGRNAVAMKAYLAVLPQAPHDIGLRQQTGATAFLSGDYVEAERWFVSAEHYRAAERERWQMGDPPLRVLDRSWQGAIGHLAFVDTYIKATKLGWFPDKETILAYDSAHPPSGWPLLPFLGRHITVVGDPGNPDGAVDRRLFGEAAEKIGPAQRASMRDAVSQSFWAGPDAKGDIRWFGPWGAAVERAWKEQGHGPLHALEPARRAAFRSQLRQVFGLPEEAWYVLLHVREPGFHPGWHRYHPATRNADIRSYDTVVDFVRDKGGWVVRAGDPTMVPIAPRERVIDYATSRFRSPELDVMLCADCTYFVGSNSGLSVLPPLFGRRCALTNWSPLATMNWSPDDILIPKLARHRREKRLLSFAEMYGSMAGWSQFMRDFTGSDWELRDNTPDELLEAVQELHAEVFGDAPPPAASDLARLERFNAIALAHGGYLGSRMSYRFLERHAALLEEPGGPSA